MDDLELPTEPPSGTAILTRTGNFGSTSRRAGKEALVTPAPSFMIGSKQRERYAAVARAR
jgi:hypothetical protein